MNPISRGAASARGAGAGLAVAIAQGAFAYLPAIIETDHAISLFMLTANAVFLALIGSVSGVLIAWLPALLMTGLGYASGEVPGAALALVASGLALRWPRPVLAVSLALALCGIAWVRFDLPGERAEMSDTRPDILLVVLDTVAYAHTSFEGLETTPNLAELAARGISFQKAEASAPWTIPSHAAMFTGRHPRSVGGHHEHMTLDEDVPTLAESLEQLGYETAAFAANPWIGPVSGLTRGFSHVELQWQGVFALRRLSVSRIPSKGATSKAGNLLVTNALRWLGTGTEAPRFAFINLMEAHAPYAQTKTPEKFGAKDWEAVSQATHAYQTFGPQATSYPESDAQVENARLVYRAAVHNADRVLGKLIDGLEESGQLDRTVLIVTSDHGEAFGERGFHGHILGLGDETLHVPLVIFDPRDSRRGVRIETPVNLPQIHPTILSLADARPYEGSLLASPRPDVVIISEQQRPLHFLERFEPHSSNLEALRELDRSRSRARLGMRSVQVEVDPASGHESWASYDLTSDRLERAPLPLGKKDEPLADALRRHRDQPLHKGQSGVLKISKDLRDYLEALGYAAESDE